MNRIGTQSLAAFALSRPDSDQYMMKARWSATSDLLFDESALVMVVSCRYIIRICILLIPLLARLNSVSPS